MPSDEPWPLPNWGPGHQGPYLDPQHVGAPMVQGQDVRQGQHCRTNARQRPEPTPSGRTHSQAQRGRPNPTHCTECPGLPGPGRGTCGHHGKGPQHCVRESHRVRAGETAGAPGKGLAGNGHCAWSWPRSGPAMQLPRGHARGTLRPNAPHLPPAPSILAKKKNKNKKKNHPKTLKTKHLQENKVNVSNERNKPQPVHPHVTTRAAAPSWARPEGGRPEPPPASLAPRSTP